MYYVLQSLSPSLQSLRPLASVIRFHHWYYGRIQLLCPEYSWITHLDSPLPKAIHCPGEEQRSHFSRMQHLNNMPGSYTQWGSHGRLTKTPSKILSSAGYKAWTPQTCWLSVFNGWSTIPPVYASPPPSRTGTKRLGAHYLLGFGHKDFFLLSLFRFIICWNWLIQSHVRWCYKINFTFMK
jgi:hypothetical protein